MIVAGNANCSWFEPYQLQTVHDLAEFVVRQIRQKSHADGKQTHKQTKQSQTRFIPHLIQLWLQCNRNMYYSFELLLKP